MADPIRVVITGAAGQIAYSLIPLFANGTALGPNQPVELRLLDIPPAMGTLGGVVMELQDCAYPTLKDVQATADPLVAFEGADIALLVGAFPRREGMERKDLLARNAGIFEEHGKAINQVAKRTVKVLVVGNPANTNCLLAQHYAPDIPARNFSALTRLDHQRAYGLLGERLGVPPAQISGAFIWGNHSATQYPDVNHGKVTRADGSQVSIREAVGDDAWLNDAFIKAVQQRGAAVIKARGLSSAVSAANAIMLHVRDWVFGTDGRIVSMAVVSDGSYGIPEGLVFSFPVTCHNGDYDIVKGLDISDATSRDRLRATTEELVSERDQAFEVLGKTAGSS